MAEDYASLKDLIKTLKDTLKPFLNRRDEPFCELPREPLPHEPADPTARSEDASPPAPLVVPLRSPPASAYVKREYVAFFGDMPLPAAVGFILDVLHSYATTSTVRKKTAMSSVLEGSSLALARVLEDIAQNTLKATNQRLLDRIVSTAARLDIPKSQLPKDTQELGSTLGLMRKAMKARGVLLTRYKANSSDRGWQIARSSKVKKATAATGDQKPGTPPSDTPLAPGTDAARGGTPKDTPAAPTTPRTGTLPAPDSGTPVAVVQATEADGPETGSAGATDTPTAGGGVSEAARVPGGEGHDTPGDATGRSGELTDLLATINSELGGAA